MICEIAPAKINLTLEILNKRKDGYHEINTIMQTVDICDVLTFWDNKWLKIIPEYKNLPLNDSLPIYDNFNYLNNNLVYKTARVLQKETGFNGGAVIHLNKHIPSSAGLGGGSSDAAATLRGLNRLWKLKLSPKDLAAIGAKIGSDVPFFIYGGTCLATGRGEIIERLNLMSEKWIAITLLPINIKQKTKMLYSFITPENYTEGVYTRDLAELLKYEGGNYSGNGNGNGSKNGNGNGSKNGNGNGSKNGNGNKNRSGIGINAIGHKNAEHINGANNGNSNNTGHEDNSSGKNGKIIFGNYSMNSSNDYLFNVFENIYYNNYVEFKQWIDSLQNIYNGKVNLAGSGPAVYYISDSEAEIMDAIVKIPGTMDFKKYIARTVP